MDILHRIWVDLGSPSLISGLTMILSVCAIFGKVGKRLDNRIKKIYNDDIVPVLSEKIEKDKKDMLDTIDKVKHEINHRTDGKIKGSLDLIGADFQNIKEKIQDLKEEVDYRVETVKEIIAAIKD